MASQVADPVVNEYGAKLLQAISRPFSSELLNVWDVEVRGGITDHRCAHKLVLFAQSTLERALKDGTARVATAIYKPMLTTIWHDEKSLIELSHHDRQSVEIMLHYPYNGTYTFNSLAALALEAYQNEKSLCKGLAIHLGVFRLAAEYGIEPLLINAAKESILHAKNASPYDTFGSTLLHAFNLSQERCGKDSYAKYIRPEICEIVKEHAEDFSKPGAFPKLMKTLVQNPGLAEEVAGFLWKRTVLEEKFVDVE